MGTPNPFDQFDGPAPKAAVAANPFDKFDHAEYVPTYGGIGHNAVAGTNEGIAKTFGYPADVVGGLVNQAAYGVNKLVGRKVLADDTQPFGGSEYIMHHKGLSTVGEEPTSVEAHTPTERIARGAGEGAGSMVAGAAMGAAAGIKGGYSALRSVLGNPTPATAAVGAISGATAETAGELAPDGYKTGARIAGGLVGGVVPVGARVLYEGGKYAVAAGREFAKPFTKSGQESLAAEKIAGAAHDVHAVRDSLETGPHEVVPGSKPTTFQQTGDMGLGQLERQVRTDHPDDFLQRAAEQNSARRTAIQNTQATGSPAEVSAHFRGMRDSLDRVTEDAVHQARQRTNQATAAMGGSGNPEQYGAALREPAANARAAAKQAENTLWDAVDPNGNLVMPGTPIANVAKNLEGQLSRSAKPLAGEERDIFDVAQRYSDHTPFKDIRDLRSRISTALSEELKTNGRTPAYARLTQLRGAVERTIDRAIENQANVEKIAVARGQAQAEDTMAGRLASVGQTRPAKVINGQDAGGAHSLLEFIASKGGLGPDAELHAIGAHSHTVNVEGVGRRKLVRQGGWPLDYAREAAEEAGYLRGNHNGTSTVNDLLDIIDAEMRGNKRYPEGFEGHQGKRESAAMSEREQHEHYQFVRGYEDDLRDAGHGELGAGVKQRAIHLMANEHMDADMAVEYAIRQMDHEESRAAIYPSRASENGRGIGENGGGGRGAEAASAAGLRSRAPPISMEEGIPLDPAAAQRLKDASTATRERASTFDEGATGTILKPGARAGEYRTPDSLVPSKVFHPGANGGEDVRHYIAAAGEDHALPVIADYAAMSLRKFAVRPDGSIDTAKALAWAKQHDAALAELPASVRNRLANPGRAEEAVAAATTARKEQFATFDRSAVAHVMGTEEGDVVRQIGAVLNSRDAAARMQELATAAKGNPAAKAGLRRAVIDHVQSQFLSNAEAATSGQTQIKADAFQTFMRTKADVLAKVFTPEEIGVLRAVSTDLQRANRSINATKLPGGSNTAQDTAHRTDGTVLSRIAVEGAAAAAGHAITKSVGGGILGWLGVKATAALRDAGLSNVDSLVKEAMLNPELARALLMKVPVKPDTGAAARIVQTVKRMAIVGPTIGASQTNRQ